MPRVFASRRGKKTSGRSRGTNRLGVSSGASDPMAMPSSAKPQTPAFVSLTPDLVWATLDANPSPFALPSTAIKQWKWSNLHNAFCFLACVPLIVAALVVGRAQYDPSSHESTNGSPACYSECIDAWPRPAVFGQTPAACWCMPRQHTPASDDGRACFGQCLDALPVAVRSWHAPAACWAQCRRSKRLPSDPVGFVDVLSSCMSEPDLAFTCFGW